MAKNKDYSVKIFADLFSVDELQNYLTVIHITNTKEELTTNNTVDFSN